MRLLIISFAFPPHNSIGGVRVGKTAKYLARFGHDVRVLTARDQPFKPTLPVELPAERVTYSKWFAPRGTRPLGEAAPAATNANSAEADAPAQARASLRQSLGHHVKAIIDFPDANAGWMPYALAAGSRLCREWRPDLIFASSPPPTSLVVAYRLAKKFGVPWVGDLRDLWVDHPYYHPPRWRRILEERLERRVLTSAGGLVTVSQPLADSLRAKFGAEAEVVLNGFDPGDYPPPRSSSPRAGGGGRLSILYTGMIYPGRRDPSPLFAALRMLGERARSVRVTFHGLFLESAQRLARDHGVEHLVEVKGSVPYAESLRLQTEADVLLLLLWSDPTERGVYTGKLFEYMGARRPILAVGGVDTVAADMIRERSLGAALAEPARIAAQLAEWIDLKEREGALPDLPAAAAAGVSREEQTRLLEAYLLRVLASPGRRLT